MTYFGLDILPAKINGKTELIIGEIGGIDTGRVGFSLLYDDNRVNEQIRSMINLRYGEVLFNNGLFNTVFQKTGLSDYDSVLEYASRNLFQQFNDDSIYVESPQNPFGKEIYLGQEGSYVANAINPPKGPKLINPFIAQYAARDKASQLFIISHFKNSIPYIRGEIYGAKDSDLCAILGPTDKVVVKQSTGSCGVGIAVLSRKEIVRRSRNWEKTGDELASSPDTVKNRSLRIMQPFYDTSISNGIYGSIRSVVCNEEFVDAYMRVSEDPIVNLSRNAEPVSLDGGLKREVARLSEMVVAEFLRISALAEKEMLSEEE